MRYLFRATGRNADDLMDDATRKVNKFAGERSWEFVDFRADGGIFRGDGETLVHYADVEAWVES